VTETANLDAAHVPCPRAGCPTGRDAGDWRRQAACRGEDPELFFPAGSAGPALMQIAEAKKTCARCPVRTPCLRFALVTGQDYGIWSGRTGAGRRRLRSRSGSDPALAGGCARPLC
jgi:WhiB family redox-sensing transcriptional regulator